MSSPFFAQVEDQVVEYFTGDESLQAAVNGQLKVLGGGHEKSPLLG